MVKKPTAYNNIGIYSPLNRASPAGSLCFPPKGPFSPYPCKQGTSPWCRRRYYVGMFTRKEIRKEFERERELFDFFARVTRELSMVYHTNWMFNGDRSGCNSLRLLAQTMARELLRKRRCPRLRIFLSLGERIKVRGKQNQRLAPSPSPRRLCRNSYLSLRATQGTRQSLCFQQVMRLLRSFHSLAMTL